MALLSSKCQPPCVAPSAAASLPDSILSCIFTNPRPVLPLGNTGSLQLRQLARLGEVAGVNRQWRSVAAQMFYRVAVVAVVKPPHDSSDPEIKVRTNIHLIRAMERVDSVREVQVVMEGGRLPTHELVRFLNISGLGVTAWPGAVQLQFVAQCVGFIVSFPLERCGAEQLKPLNELLSRVLPSLRRISFTGVRTECSYECVPIAQLINERLKGPKPLSDLRINCDCPVELNPDQSRPIALERLVIDSLSPIGSKSMPLTLASTLVQLTLSKISVDWFWDSFVVDNPSSTSTSGLTFYCLRFLSLSTFGSHTRGWPLIPQSESFITDTDDDSSSYTTSSTFGRPQFPALTTLVVAYFPKSYNQFLTLFASSPITRFSVLGSSFNLPSSINLSQFRHLRSIEAQIEGGLWDHCSTFVNKWLSDMLATAGSQLEHLSIMLDSDDEFRFRITAPPAFARNITSLKLDDHIAIDDVGLILQQLPNLIKLELGPRTQVPIYSEPELISALRTAEASHQLTPLSTSLKLLRVWRSELCTSQDQFNPNSSSRAYASFFKGMLVELACRLPSLELLRVAVSPIEDIQDAVNLLVNSGIASELIGHLRKLQIRSEAE